MLAVAKCRLMAILRSELQPDLQQPGFFTPARSSRRPPSRLADSWRLIKRPWPDISILRTIRFALPSPDGSLKCALDQWSRV
jgi:hypothetical protein